MSSRGETPRLPFGDRDGDVSAVLAREGETGSGEEGDGVGEVFMGEGAEVKGLGECEGGPEVVACVREGEEDGDSKEYSDIPPQRLEKRRSPADSNWDNSPKEPLKNRK